MHTTLHLVEILCNTIKSWNFQISVTCNSITTACTVLSVIYLYKINDTDAEKFIIYNTIITVISIQYNVITLLIICKS